ncbi:PKD-like family lipoprotein [Pedobacter metabolipauper]|uniref:PKD family protein n=1 Tax=Pedobacter metabolipauper TaxID=425513 RepID=A0A4R6SRX6_9SPHI|nr:PKD-like family lipoprotein [Pedobacter metabolipauper]TDQ07127.1 PKD family protein [Pedobacter metabolipauper]
MRFKQIYLLAFVAILYTSCKKDLGNYTYSPPSSPVIVGIQDVTFSALIGDSLIIKPTVSLADADPLKDLDFEWRILILEDLKEIVFKGYPLRMLYNLGPGERSSTLTVTDKRNGLKYKYPFKVAGTTQFSIGKLVLSLDNGVSKLSFVKPDNVTILSDVYQTLNGASLAANPVQLYYSKPLPYQVLTKEEYWILSNDPSKSGVILDASTLLRKSDFTSQFFLPPATITPGYLEPFLGPVQMGTVPTGVINGKLYVGVQSTAPFAPDYGKFANEQAGDYILSSYFTHGGSFFFGFDTKAKAFVIFGGDGSYLGTNYLVPAVTIFDPKNIGMDNLIYMKAVETGSSYAFFRQDGTTTELKFSLSLNSTDKKIEPESKRIFKGSAMVDADTKWVRNSLNVFYFSSNDKIYRYNPINEEIKVLEAGFGGKKVSMLKISDDDNTLTVGVSGSVYSLDVSVGKNGNITQTINGIPGSPVDILIRK